PRTVVIVEGLHAEMVARAEQEPPARVPESEGEVAEQVLGAALAPARVSLEDELSVRHGGRSREQGAQFLTVVDPGVGGERELARRVREGEPLVERLGRGPENPVAEAARAGYVRAMAIRASVREPLQHPV